MVFQKFDSNPLIRPGDARPTSDAYEVIGTFNAGATRFGEEILLLVRVAERPFQEEGYVIWPQLQVTDDGPEVVLHKLRKDTPGLELADARVVVYNGHCATTSISHLRLARSRDGRDFTLDDAPAIQATEPYEEYGVEDPRITRIGDTWYINYSAISSVGITTALASTKDFRTFEKHGPIFGPDNKDVAIFPEKINGRYFALTRPQSAFGGPPAMWTAESPDLIHWSNHRYLMGPRPGLWDLGRIGCSCVPVKTERGWLEIYHGATQEVVYCLGTVLLDLEDPTRILSRPEQPVMEPVEVYETDGFIGRVCFACGHVENPDGSIYVYYGGADAFTCGAETTLDALLSTV